MKYDFIAKVDLTCTSFFFCCIGDILVVQSTVRKEKEESRFVLHFHVSF